MRPATTPPCVRMLFPQLSSFYMTRSVLSYLTPFELQFLVSPLNRWAHWYVRRTENLSIVYGRTDPSLSLFCESPTGQRQIKTLDLHTRVVSQRVLDVFPLRLSKFKSIEAVDNTVYVVGGFDEELNQITSFCYQSKGTKISAVSSMHTPRIAFSLVTFGSFLLVVGGFNNGTLATCERMHLSTHSWTPMSPLIIQRCDAILCAFNGNCVYAFGGTDGHTPLNSIECYRSSSQDWQLLPPTVKQGYVVSRYGGCAHQISAQEIMILGGKGRYAQPVQECYIYSAKKNEFVGSLEMGAENADNLEIHLEQDQLYVLGETAQLYNCHTKTWALA